jgi:hypothetical protein
LIRVLKNETRAARLVRDVIRRTALNLTSLTVLTEVGTGPFVLTPIIAAMAGAEVLAITRSSRYGTPDEVVGYARHLISQFGLGDQIDFISDTAASMASKADIVTNLGFVRPIDRLFVNRLKSTAVISLMWAPWEFREADIDRSACTDASIPIIGTNENHPDVRTYEYVGLLATKLLLEREVEILGARIAIIASDPFGSAIRTALHNLGAQLVLVDPTQHGCDLQLSVGIAIEDADAVVVAEHRDDRVLLDGNTLADFLARQRPEIIHICGCIDGLMTEKHPANNAPFGVMTVTTDYLGPKPVIDLHAAGLKAGEVVARSRLAGLSCDEAVRRAEQSGYGARLP